MPSSSQPVLTTDDVVTIKFDDIAQVLVKQALDHQHPLSQEQEHNLMINRAPGLIVDQSQGYQYVRLYVSVGHRSWTDEVGAAISTALWAADIRHDFILEV